MPKEKNNPAQPKSQVSRLNDVMEVDTDVNEDPNREKLLDESVDAFLKIERRTGILEAELWSLLSCFKTFLYFFYFKWASHEAFERPVLFIYHFFLGYRHIAIKLRAQEIIYKDVLFNLLW